MTRTSLKALATVIAGVALFAGGRSILAQSTPTAPIGTSVATSLHNLNNVYGTNAIHNDYGTSQVCLPCHTPHSVPTANLNLAKLWNHQMSSATYVTYNGTASSTSYLSSVDEVSRKCLSCHDGTVAVDAFGNNPSLSGTIGTMKSNPSTVGFVVGDNGNLQHDHPIDVLYNSSSKYTGTNTTATAGTFTYAAIWSSTSKNDPSTFSITGYTSSKWGTTNNYTVNALSAISFYKPSGSTQPVTITDSNPTGASSSSTTGGVTTYTHTLTVGSQYVYCLSCHDPHNSGPSGSYHFLKVPNDNSQLCLTCHNK